MSLTQNEKVLIFVPTLNEFNNVGPLIKELTSIAGNFDILFLDDNSSDGTAEELDKIALNNSKLFVIHRKGAKGIGSAHKEGIAWAYRKGYSTLVTMDADFTHPPEKIPFLFKGTENFDVVVGSRYLESKSLAGWNPLRKTLTWTAHFLTTFLLGLKYDSTGAFRLYRLNRIAPSVFESVRSNGYSFFFESLHILNLNKFSIHEIPIVLPPRTYGSSKMSYREALKSIKMLFTIYFQTKRMAKNSLKSELTWEKETSFDK